MNVEFADSSGKPTKTLDGLPIVLLSGEIKPGDNQKLERFVYVNHKDMGSAPHAIIVYLDSPGGDVEEALKLADALKEMMTSVMLRPDMRCVSSCFFLYVNAPMHSAARKAAIHRPYLSPERVRDLSAADAPSLHNRIYKGLQKWLQDRLVPQAIIDRLLGAPSSDAYTLTPEDLDAIGERSAWYEEWLLARCPDYVNAEKKAKELSVEGYPLGKEFEEAL